MTSITLNTFPSEPSTSSTPLGIENIPTHPTYGCDLEAGEFLYPLPPPVTFQGPRYHPLKVYAQNFALEHGYKVAIKSSGESRQILDLWCSQGGEAIPKKKRLADGSLVLPKPRANPQGRRSQKIGCNFKIHGRHIVQDGLSYWTLDYDHPLDHIGHNHTLANHRKRSSGVPNQLGQIDNANNTTEEGCASRLDSAPQDQANEDQEAAYNPVSHPIPQGETCFD